NAAGHGARNTAANLRGKSADRQRPSQPSPLPACGGEKGRGSYRFGSSMINSLDGVPFLPLCGPHSGHPGRPFARPPAKSPVRRFGRQGEPPPPRLRAEPARQARRHARPVRPTRPHAPAWRLRARPCGPNAPRSWPPGPRAVGRLRVGGFGVFGLGAKFFQARPVGGGGGPSALVVVRVLEAHLFPGSSRLGTEWSRHQARVTLKSPLLWETRFFLALFSVSATSF